jgi:curved DNA-binding protein
MNRAAATPYKRLGILPGATLDEVRSAYRRLARRHHPDAARHATPSGVDFQQVHEAYRTLVDAAQRPARKHQHATLAITLEEAVHGGSYLFRGKQRLDLPPGLLAGEKLQLRGKGEQGDLHVTIAYAPHARFRVAKGNVYIEAVLMPWEAALGTPHKLATLDGIATLPIPPGTPTGKQFRLKGRGLPQPGGKRGDLHVTVSVRMPKTASAR